MELLEQLEKAYGVKIVPSLYGNGHINKTYVTATSPRLIIQEINTGIFKNPEAMMENILSVTAHISKKLEAEGKDKARYTLTVAPTADGKPFIEINGKFFRAYLFIEDSVCYDLVTPETLEKAGFAFGAFQSYLADFPAETLSEVIPDFHNTPARFETFLSSVEKDVKGRAKEDAEEIAFFRAHHYVFSADAAGKLRDAAAGAEAFIGTGFAVAYGTVGTGTDVTDFASHIVGAGIEMTVQNKPRAKTGAEGEENHVAAVFAGAVFPFRQSTGVGVVLHKGGRAVALLKPGDDGNFIPAGQVGRGKNQATDAVQRAAAADSNGQRGVAAAGSGKQGAENIFPARIIFGGNFNAGKHLSAFIASHPGAFGAADIKTPDFVFHIGSPSGSASIFSSQPFICSLL